MVSSVDGRMVHSVWKVPSLRWWLPLTTTVWLASSVRFRLEVLALFGAPASAYHKCMHELMWKERRRHQNRLAGLYPSSSSEVEEAPSES